MSGSSIFSVEIYESGLELRIISTSVTAVSSSSYENTALPIVFLRHLFVDRTILSKIPPVHGAFSTWNDHSILRSVKCRLTSGWFSTTLMDLAADLKVFPLSEMIF